MSHLDLGRVESDPFADDGEARRPSVWRWLPLLAALIAFELTFNPMLAVALACFRFGDADFATAWWLLKHDPDRPRAWGCAGFHVAWGFVRIMTAGLVALALVCVLVVIVLSVLGVPMSTLLDQARAATLTSLAAAAGCVLAAAPAMLVALVHRKKLWVQSGTHRQRAAGHWPPVPEVAPRRETNRVMATVAVGGAVASPALVVAVGLLLRRLGLDRDAFMTLCLSLATVQMAGLLPLMFYLNGRLPAREPAECWPEGAGAPGID